MRRRPAVMLAAAITCPIVAMASQHAVERPDQSDHVATAESEDQARRDAVRELLLELDKRQGTYGEPTQNRRLAGATPQYSGPVRRPPLGGNKPVSRDDTLRQRAALRAYDGAPPVMPHSRNFVASKSCLDCHAKGIRLGSRVAPPVSHPHLLSCMQCHVEQRNLELLPPPPIENAFTGTQAPAGSERPWTQAPPVMPHPTLMRTDCLSCHGSEAYPGLATDHPQRRSCLQCHAPAASLNQTSPFFSGNATLLRPSEAAPEPPPPDP